jgi:hypothetical protein
VGFRSVVGRGTIFRVRIPLVAQFNDDMSRVTSNSIRLGHAESSEVSPEVRIVFETNEETALRAQEALSREGYAVLMSKRSELTGRPDWQARVNSMPVICVDQESLSDLLSRRVTQEGVERPPSTIVFIGARTGDFPSNGIVVLPDNEQGYLVLPRLIGHALNTHQR